MSQRVMAVEQVRKLAKTRRRSRRDEERAVVDNRRESYRLATEPITARLPLPPMLNHYYRHIIIAGHQSKTLSREGALFRREIIAQWRKVGVTFEGLLAMKIEVTFPDNRQRDIDGYLKSLLDALEHAGAYRNDSQIKLLIIEHNQTEKPGWVDVIIGPKPGERQGTLFGTEERF